MSNEKKTDKTLTADDIISSQHVGRRGALGMMGATVLGAAALATGLASSAKAQTDSDSGPGADRSGGGRTGGTDSDTGPGADRGNHGRTGATDSDSGPGADRGGHGR